LDWFCLRFNYGRWERGHVERRLRCVALRFDGRSHLYSGLRFGFWLRFCSGGNRRSFRGWRRNWFVGRIRDDLRNFSNWFWGWLWCRQYRAGQFCGNAGRGYLRFKRLFNGLDLYRFNRRSGRDGSGFFYVGRLDISLRFDLRRMSFWYRLGFGEVKIFHRGGRSGPRHRFYNRLGFRKDW
jgi:hypothetical protein